MTNRHMNIFTDKLEDIQVNWQMDRLTNRQIDIWTDWLIVRLDKYLDRWTDGHKDRWTDGKMERHMNLQTDKRINQGNNYNLSNNIWKM
jgi:hypothetical protein